MAKTFCSIFACSKNDFSTDDSLLEEASGFGGMTEALVPTTSLSLKYFIILNNEKISPLFKKWPKIKKIGRYVPIAP